MSQGVNSYQGNIEHEILDENMYIVQKILKKRTIVKNGSHKVMYYVRWQGYPNPQDHTWEPQQNLKNVTILIEQFDKKLTQKKRRQGNDEYANKQITKVEASKISAKNNEPQFRNFQNQQKISGSNSQKIIKKTSEPLNKLQQKQSFEPQIIHKIKHEISRERESLKPPVQNIAKKFNSESQKEAKPEQLKKITSYPINYKQYSNQKEAVSSKHQKPAKPAQKRQELVYGQVVNHIYKDDQLFFEVEKLSKDKKVSNILQINSETVINECLKGAYQYLQKLIIRLQQANKQK